MTNPGATQVIRDGVIFRATAEETKTIFGAADEGIWWKIMSSTWYNTDTGDQKF